MSSDKSTTTYDSKEEQRYLENIQAEIESLSNLCFKLDRSILPGGEKNAAILLSLLSYIGARSDDFLREFRQPSGLGVGLLAYLGRSIFEAHCILCYLLSLAPPDVAQEVIKQIALDKEDLHKNIDDLFPQELKQKLPPQRARWNKLKDGTKRWDMRELVKTDSSLNDLYKKYYPFFNKFAHPTAFSLFCKEDEGAIRAARGAYLMMTYRCLIETTTRFANSLSKS